MERTSYRFQTKMTSRGRQSDRMIENVELRSMSPKDSMQINKTTSREDSSVEDEQMEIVNQHQEMTTGVKEHIIGDKEEQCL